MLLVESCILTDNVVRANQNFASPGLCRSFSDARNCCLIFFYMLLVESSILTDKVVRARLLRCRECAVTFRGYLTKLRRETIGHLLGLL
jgi:hypothetical protein